jgi:allantoinase
VPHGEQDWTRKRAEEQRKAFGSATNILLALIGLLISAGPAVSENTRDWITGLPREPIHVKAWPAGKKVAVCFILYVEVWGFGHASRNAR